MRKPLAQVRIPGVTYRLQFNREFTFNDARELLDYLDELGITDCYSSPIFLAPSESNHGYDVCDYNQLNPVLGTAGDWENFSSELQKRGMGLLLDFVPNHMSTNVNLNGWWRDVLEYGHESQYARFFDINWNPPDLNLKNRVCLPVLEDHYSRVLEKGLIKLALKDGGLYFQYHDNFWPLNPRSYTTALELAVGKPPTNFQSQIRKLKKFLSLRRKDAARPKLEIAEQILANKKLAKFISERLNHFNRRVNSGTAFDSLHTLLDMQSYRPSYWRSGMRTANYRRFFDVDGLLAVNMERPEVFDAAHQLIGNLVQKGQVSGVRIDHIDGLAAPSAYLKLLQKNLSRRSSASNFYMLVEKITLQNERLREDWPVFGTTGYEFSDAVGSVLTDPGNEAAFDKIYAAFVPQKISFAESVSRAKAFVMQRLLGRELEALTELLATSVKADHSARDVLRDDLKAAISSVIAAFPVYRTYLTRGTSANPIDTKIIKESVARARPTERSIDPLAFELVETALLENRWKNMAHQQSMELFRQRFQQLTGPVMAKGCEDTAFFVYNRLIGSNEVGGNPERFGSSPEAFHQNNLLRLKHQPHTMVATSTHDTKMSEDARARALALSQIPHAWEQFLKKAESANVALKTDVGGELAPDRNEEYRLYQVLLTAWPLETLTTKSRAVFTDRIQQHTLKAIREEKTHTRWDAPNIEWENAVSRFIKKIINQPSPAFRAQFRRLFKTVSELGMLNSLSQTLLKLTAPGVPDIYQGNELWQFLLTDPDNRRPIDFACRRKMMESLPAQKPKALLANWQTGAIKMFLTKTILNFRRSHRELFDRGDYTPLKFSGKYPLNCIGYSRTWKKQSIIVLAPRLTASLGFPPIGDYWGHIMVRTGKLKLRNLFTGATVEGNRLSLADVFADLPFAALVTD